MYRNRNSKYRPIPFMFLLLPLLSLIAAALMPLVNATGTPSAMAWYAAWHAPDFPLSNVSWHKYDQLFYAFATTTPDPSLLSLQPSDLTLLPAFVSTAHKNAVKASLSIGGWTGSRWFSSNLATPTNRSIFLNTVLALAQQYHLDGLDFDWEFPNQAGLECNLRNPNDTQNFLSFLQLLRTHPLASNLTISAPTWIVPFASQAGTPSTNLSAFASVLDFISIMNYDVWRPTLSSTTGPNAPLNDSCLPQLPTQDRNGSAVSAVSAWHAAGIPLNQIVLAVPAYGHSFNVSPSNAYQAGTGDLALYTPFNPTPQPPGDAWDNGAGLDPCGNPIGVGGLWTFWGMVNGGYLNAADGTPLPLPGLKYRYDDCSQTPYLYKEDQQIWISYDSPQSFAAKGSFIRAMGLRGFSIWEAAGDLNDLLLDAIRNAAVDGNDPFLANGPSSQSKSPSSSITTHSFSLTLLIALTVTLGLALGL